MRITRRENIDNTEQNTKKFLGTRRDPFLGMSKATTNELS